MEEVLDLYQEPINTDEPLVSVWIKTLIFQQIFKFVIKSKSKLINKIIISPLKIKILARY